jgi:AcrR family transcriptional regulator
MHSSNENRKRLGRPRDGRIDRDVVAAVLGVLRSEGYRAVTIENIARRVKRARTSLYRRWPSKRHLVAFAIVHELGVEPSPNSGSLRKDLLAAVETLRKAFAGPFGSALAGLAADMAHDAALACLIRTVVLAPRRDSMRAALKRGQVRGEIAGDLDGELLLDMLTAPYYFRVLFRHGRITSRMNAKIVDYALRAASSRFARAAARLPAARSRGAPHPRVSSQPPLKSARSRPRRK